MFDVDVFNVDVLSLGFISTGVFSSAVIALLVSMALALVRALKGPTLFDRLLAANMFGTKTVLLIAVFGFLSGRTEFMDLALIYALMNFVGTIAVLKFSRYGTLGSTGDKDSQASDGQTASSS